MARLPGACQVFDLLTYAMLRVTAPEVGRCIDVIESEVSTWPCVWTRGHRFGGTEFGLIGNDEEFGHIHGSGVVDLKANRSMLPSSASEDLAALLQPHHVYPASRTWSTFAVRRKDDVTFALEALRLSYEASKRRIE